MTEELKGCPTRIDPCEEALRLLKKDPLSREEAFDLFLQLKRCLESKE